MKAKSVGEVRLLECARTLAWWLDNRAYRVDSAAAAAELRHAAELIREFLPFEKTELP